jgi:Serine dehydrogenase proteinase
MAKKKLETIEIKNPPILFTETQELISQIQSKIVGDFMSYWVSGNSRIIMNDVISFYEILKNKQRKKRLYFFIRSGGGNGQASLRIVNLLRAFYDEIVAFVPLDCASAATMLVLGADKIEMGALAYLSAVDTSITHDLSPVDKDNDLVSVSQVELSRVIKLWEEKKQPNDANPYNTLYQHIHPLVFGAVDRASSLSMKLTSEILSYHMLDTEKVDAISQQLNSAYPSHGYPITYREAQKIGLNVVQMSIEINELLLALNNNYSEMAQLAYTDFDELNYHDNEILKIIETDGVQIFYQKDKDMHYRAEERKWVPMNDVSSWRRIVQGESGFVESKFYNN